MNVCVFCFLMICLLNLGSSCICFGPASFESEYCGADRSIRGRVIAQFTSCSTEDCRRVGLSDPVVIFIVRVVNVFKGPPVKDNLLYLSTSYRTSCTTGYEIDTDYLFNLKELTKVMHNTTCPPVSYSQSLCDFPFVWNSLPQDLKEFAYNNSKTDQSFCKNVPLPTPFLQI